MAKPAKKKSGGRAPAAKKRTTSADEAPEMRSAPPPNSAARDAAMAKAHDELSKIDAQKSRLSERASSIMNALKEEYGVSKQAFGLVRKIAKLEGAARATMISDLSDGCRALDLFQDTGEIGRAAERMAGRAKKKGTEDAGAEAELPLQGQGAKRAKDEGDQPEDASAYLESLGEKAAKAGDGEDANPYPEGSDARTKWARGYARAKEGQPATRH